MGLKNMWVVPGWLLVDPGFNPPPGIQYIGENEKAGLQKLPKPGKWVRADAVILPGVGLVKARCSGRIVLKSYDPATNTYTIEVTSGWDGPTLFFPINGWNPFGKGLGDVPGNAQVGSTVNEGALPKPNGGGQYPGGAELPGGAFGGRARSCTVGSYIDPSGDQNNQVIVK